MADEPLLMLRAGRRGGSARPDTVAVAGASPPMTATAGLGTGTGAASWDGRAGGCNGAPPLSTRLIGRAGGVVPVGNVEVHNAEFSR